MTAADEQAPLIVLCAGTAWSGVRRGDRMLVEQLRHHTRVLWVDPEKSVLTRARFRQGGARRLAPELTQPAPQVIRLAPVVLPLHTRPGVRQTTPAAVRAQIRWALRKLGAQPQAVIDSRMAGVLGDWGPGVRSVLFGKDDYVAGAALMGRDEQRLRRDEREALARAQVVLAISEPLAQRWRQLGADVTMIPNGVAVEEYDAVDSTPPAPGVDLPAPVAGVVGHLSERIDIALLEAVVAAGLSLLLVGPRDPRWEPERFARLAESPRVRWVGQQPFEALPGYLRHIDVGLTPYQNSPFNRASFPLKTLEYLAAGRPVVSTDLPATRWLDTDLVTVTSGVEQFVAAVQRAAAQAHQPDLVAARRAFAAGHSWHSRARQVAEVLGLPGPSPSEPASPSRLSHPHHCPETT